MDQDEFLKILETHKGSGLFPDQGIIKARKFLEDIIKFETTDTIGQI